MAPGLRERPRRKWTWRVAARLVRRLKRRARCGDCGLTGGRLTFDHLPGRDKRFDIGRPRRSSGALVSLRALTAEILKCELVCRPCHDLRERARRICRPFEVLRALAEIPAPPDGPRGQDAHVVGRAFEVLVRAAIGLAAQRAAERRARDGRTLKVEIGESWIRGAAIAVARERRRASSGAA